MGRQMCELCKDRRAALIRPRNRQQLCQQCFFVAFENEIHKTIVDNRLFKPGERVAIAASGGKDSTVLAHVLTELNRRHNYGLDLFLLSIDEGITGYRDDSLETVKRNEIQYGIPLEVLSYKALYGWSMDEIVREIGRKNNCTFCGVFRRQVPNEIHVFASLWFLLIWELSMLRVDVILKSAMTYIGFC
jgi:cytoplasmic tRNA 2-thiolation protein 1